MTDITVDMLPVLSDYQAGMVCVVGEGTKIYTYNIGDIKSDVEALKANSGLRNFSRFVGIFDNKEALATITNPQEGETAIVISPEDSYFSYKSGSWVFKHKVVDHQGLYLGLFNTLSDLTSAHGVADEGALALTANEKKFYLYSSGWKEVTNPASAAAAASTSHLESEVDGLKIGQSVLENNLKQKLNGIQLSDDSGTSLSDIKGLKFINAEVSDANADYTADVTVNPKISVADGQAIGSTSIKANAIIFQGQTVRADPNDASVAYVDINSGSSASTLKVSDGVAGSVSVDEIHFKGLDMQGTPDHTTVNIEVEFKHFQTIAERDQWTTKFEGIMTFPVICVVDRDDNGFVQTYRLDHVKHAWEEYNLKGIILADSDGAIPKNIKTVVLGTGFSIQQAGDKEDAALISYTGATTTSHAMTINGKLVSDLGVMAPLQIDQMQGQDRLLVSPRAYEEQHAASCLLQLDSDLTLEEGHPTKLYTPHEIIPTGSYFSLNKGASGVNVQDNTGGDTATGGELTRILASVSFYGKASDSSRVKVWLWYKDPASPLAGGVLEDVNGKPMMVERLYNRGDDLSQPLILTGAMMATGQAPIVLYVECSAGSYVVNPDKTLLCLEQFNDGYETDLASIEFQRRLGVTIVPEIKSFKTKMLSLKDELDSTVIAEGTIPKLSGYDFLNEFGVQNLTPITASIGSSELLIKDTGNIADFYVDLYLDNIKTSMLRGKVINYGAVLRNPHEGYNLAVYKWTGKADRVGRIYDTRSNGSPTLNTGFSLIKEKFIAEKADGQAYSYTDSVTIPDDAVNVLIAIIPVSSQAPIELGLRDFYWGVPKPFKGYAEVSLHNVKETHLESSESYAEFALNSQGYESIRYTINDTPSSGNPMPVGRLLKGKAPVEVDNTVNVVSGSQDPQNDGGIKFLRDGEASVSKSYNVRNEQGTESTVTFWDVLIGTDGQEYKIVDSEKTFRVPANTGASGAIYSIPAYTTQVETGQRIAGRATSSEADGAYVQTDNLTEYLVQTVVDFKEDVVDSSDAHDLVSVPYPKKLVVDRRVYSFSGNSSHTIDVDLTIPSDVELADVRVVTKRGEVVSSDETVEYSYSSTNERLTVYVGADASDGKIYMEFWA